MSEKTLPPVVVAERLVRVFGQGSAEVRAVDGVDLTVPAGELLLIMGPSGSGKTTLLSLIGGLLRPTAGRVVVDGTEITALGEHEMAPVRRRLVGFIFQSFNLLEALSVEENVEVALDVAGVKGRPAKERAQALLGSLGMKQRLAFGVKALSGGEKQRVSIARALANEPRLLLADEPTANLDSRHGREVMEILLGIAHGGDRSVIVVSHDQRIRAVADRVLWLEDGHLSEVGRLVRDPVCGMDVEADRALSARHDGHDLFFCSRGCLAEFEAAPSRFADDELKAAGIGNHPATSREGSNRGET